LLKPPQSIPDRGIVREYVTTTYKISRNFLNFKGINIRRKFVVLGLCLGSFSLTHECINVVTVTQDSSTLRNW